MRTPVKLAAFGGVLALAFAGAFGIGTAVGDVVAPSGPAHVDQQHGGSTTTDPDDH